jgi:hypothetical protein
VITVNGIAGNEAGFDTEEIDDIDMLDVLLLKLKAGVAMSV